MVSAVGLDRFRLTGFKKLGLAGLYYEDGGPYPETMLANGLVIITKSRKIFNINQNPTLSFV